MVSVPLQIGKHSKAANVRPGATCPENASPCAPIMAKYSLDTYTFITVIFFVIAGFQLITVIMASAIAANEKKKTFNLK